MGKHHDKDFKMHAARLVIEKGRKPRELAKELNISVPTLRNWINIYKEKRESELKFIEKSTSYPIRSEEKDKIIKDLKEENEILRKAMYVLTKKP